MFQELRPSLLKPADVISYLQDSVLEVLSEIFYHWVLDLVSSGHRQDLTPAVVQEHRQAHDVHVHRHDLSSVAHADNTLRK